MKIFLFGYGQMGKEIEKLAITRGHEITGVYDPYHAFKFSEKDFLNADIIIDYTTPGSAVYNITKAFEANKPIVVGTTGWYDEFDTVEALSKKYNGTLFYATNFSIGVNVMFSISELLAKMLNNQDSYLVSINETHHSKKKDAPSGTAITLAENLIKHMDFVDHWEKIEKGQEFEQKGGVIPIFYSREDEVVGTHEISLHSNVDKITIRHDAFNRTGFATGTLIATEWVADKRGIFTMKDLFQNIK
ncbi:MAG: 4-hydroxy-tetrahydrodipicolinate reductase [Bacteroidetes bacterium]|jgi:4-hydroxy-tetrahydrodipicolinate reductase|nr:4-hydroxy-tetrahydrodipicolinate reductase [Bacteroidota bacterium]MBT5527964.1 4-hydroxy-tetrahydrodipicolinate reductase [Cytophagia bacterium]MBT3801156.1 4-hydroxy-tetrahydrodipicolinate reductase [Bacteroidota bacterium]MBT3933909.1 4-hydroxy-tetrahydrodipicolinate reductase [Bacteroidota bacterium]MBT4339183.1 4-hydroxy-tetrahydrodipicolinate reductase [Bacteroidota bacterium]